MPIEDVIVEIARNRMRALRYLEQLENELLKGGPDEEAEWFIEYVRGRV